MFTAVPFDDVQALERAVGASDDLAAIVLEPVIERLPSHAWVRRARELCDSRGAVLVFDEIKTAFRLRTGGYQSASGIHPDLAAIGKALANGYPLSAVVGRADVMEAARRTWISSTLASETTSLAAAAVVLERHAREDVCSTLAATGAAMQAAVSRAMASAGYDRATIAGIDPMWMLRFDTDAASARFVELGLQNGVIFKRGAYNFASLSHDVESLVVIERAATEAFATMQGEAA
jgi:glutamate-1-semialdehyde aminotransferase